MRNPFRGHHDRDRPDDRWHPRPRRSYDREFRGRSSGFREAGPGPRGRWMDEPHPGPRAGLNDYGRDYWWLGEHELRRSGRMGSYDEAYGRFSERNRPRYSPVGGMYPAVGGRYVDHVHPRPLREDTWFSDWTRWF